MPAIAGGGEEDDYITSGPSRRTLVAVTYYRPPADLSSMCGVDEHAEGVKGVAYR